MSRFEILRITKDNFYNALQHHLFCFDELHDIELLLDSQDKFYGLSEIVHYFEPNIELIEAWYELVIDEFLASLRTMLSRYTYLITLHQFDDELASMSSHEFDELFSLKYVKIKLLTAENFDR